MFVTDQSGGIFSSNITNTPLQFTEALPSTAQLTTPVALDYNPNTLMLYWSDTSLSSIEWYSFATNQQGRFVSFEAGHVNGLVIDKIGNKLYWTSLQEVRIEVINLDGTNRTILFDTSLDKPSGIEIDTTNGYLYWTDWGTDMIERAQLDDLSTRTAIVTTGLQSPTGLALSVSDSGGKMYWCDGGTDLIEAANLDGTNRTTLVTVIRTHPFNIKIYGNYLYWTDWADAKIYWYERMTGTLSSGVDNQFGQPGALYIGPFTADNQDDCDAKCFNGGTCVFTTDDISVCECPYGYMDQTCSTVVGYCPCALP
ncbi:low-density lipoprotein receptor-related protein 6-like isoform X2 [Antedon mediterranea]